MNNDTRFMRAGVLSICLLVILSLTNGCFLFHCHSSYRSIHQCARDGDSVCVIAQVESDPKCINLPDDGGMVPLHLAAAHCHPNIVRILLSYGADLKKQAKGGATPLHFAAQEGCQAAMELLISAGAEINDRDDSNRTPMGRALEWDQDTLYLHNHGGTL